MHYQKYKPGATLSAFVECYFQWEGSADQPMVVQSPPSSFCAIVFNFGDVYQASQHLTTPGDVPAAFVSGQFTSNYMLHLRGNISMLGVVLKPSALHNMFGVRMSQLANSRAPLNFLSGIDSEGLYTKLLLQENIDSRIILLDEMLSPFIAKAKANLSIIDEAIDHIDKCRGCITVDQIANDMGVSRRYLEKRFLEKVGVSPKFYCRLKRFGSLSNVIAHNEQIDWQQIVTEYGFHDQSHLVKEFMEFNQMNPTQYHLLHREMTRFLKT